MATFCSLCANRLQLQAYEYDLEKIIKKLKPGYGVSGMLCEGCALVEVIKEEDGAIYLGFYKGGEITWRLHLEDLV